MCPPLTKENEKMKRVIREFVAVETGNPMTVDIKHIYGLQYNVQQFGDNNIKGTNIYFDFGIVIFVSEDYQKLKEEIFGEVDVMLEKPTMDSSSGPPTVAN